MKVYVFGNQDSPLDNGAFAVAEKLGKSIKNVEFVEVAPNKDLPFANKENAVILDTVQRIKKTQVFTTKDLGRISLSPITSVHDFDLGFQLKYLRKLGKLGEVTIIGIPQKKIISEPDYRLIQSILRKLVAQDMQGS
jgi:hypothetical protein